MTCPGVLLESAGNLKTYFEPDSFRQNDSSSVLDLPKELASANLSSFAPFLF